MTEEYVSLCRECTRTKATGGWWDYPGYTFANQCHGCGLKQFQEGSLAVLLVKVPTNDLIGFEKVRNLDLFYATGL